MNKDELIRFAAKRANCTQPVMRLCLDALISTIVDNVSVGEDVTIMNFGVFKRERREPKIGRNPHTNEEVPIPARDVPVFRAGKEFKKATQEQADASLSRRLGRD